MGEFDTICRKIKNVEIQGAENVARAAVKALMLKNDARSVKRLVSLRATEPALRNAVNYAKSDPKMLSLKVLKHFSDSKESIAENGSKLIKNGMKVFTHCHSSTVVKILKKAKSDGKKFGVYNTETRPLFQGRKTSKELSELRIKNAMVIDSGARVALEHSDIFLFGADAVSAKGDVANKIGTAMFAMIAKAYGVPCYSCTNSWKYDLSTEKGGKIKIEERSSKEVWERPPKGLEIMNPAFETVSARYIKGIVSELGVNSPAKFRNAVRKAYPKMF